MLPSAATPASPSDPPKVSRYIYVADRSRKKLLVYPAYEPNPQPIRVVGKADGIVQPGGVAVDPSGNVYVANGDGDDVLEFTSGAAAFVKKFTVQLSHPVNVTVDDGGTVYVVDQNDHYPGGANSAVVEYPKGSTQPNMVLLDPSPALHPLRGVAVDEHGHVWASTSESTDIWPPPKGDCQAPPDNEVYEFIFPTLMIIAKLRANTQVWGLALAHERLYASDFCSGSVQKYRTSTQRHTGAVRSSFAEPIYQTISRDHLLVVPCAGGRSNGYVAVIARSAAIVTITGGLVKPIGAAAGP